MIRSANAASATSADAVEIPVAVAVAQPAHSSRSALCAIDRFHPIAADAAYLAHQPGLAASAPVSTQDLLRAAKHLGRKAKLSKAPDLHALTPLPA